MEPAPNNARAQLRETEARATRQRTRYERPRPLAEHHTPRCYFRRTPATSAVRLSTPARSSSAETCCFTARTEVPELVTMGRVGFTVLALASPSTICSQHRGLPRREAPALRGSPHASMDPGGRPRGTSAVHHRRRRLGVRSCRRRLRAQFCCHRRRRRVCSCCRHFGQLGSRSYCRRRRLGKRSCHRCRLLARSCCHRPRTRSWCRWRWRVGAAAAGRWRVRGAAAGCWRVRTAIAGSARVRALGGVGSTVARMRACSCR